MVIIFLPFATAEAQHGRSCLGGDMWQRGQHVSPGQQGRTDIEEDQLVAGAAAERDVARVVLLQIRVLGFQGLRQHASPWAAGPH